MTRPRLPGLIGVVVTLDPVQTGPTTGRQDGFGRDFANIDEALGAIRDLAPTLDAWQFVTILNGVHAQELIDAGPPPDDTGAIAALRRLVACRGGGGHIDHDEWARAWDAAVAALDAHG